MPHDIFISYSYVAADKAAAEQVCRYLESEGFSCWMAPRDVLEGDDFAAAITNAIHDCRVLLLIFSAAANASRQIARELKLADDEQKPILPIRTENVSPSGTFAYFLGAAHWLDAIGGIQEEHLQRLALGLRKRFLNSHAHISVGTQERPQPPDLLDSAPGGPDATAPTLAHSRKYATGWSGAKSRYSVVFLAVVILGITAWWQANKRIGSLRFTSQKAVQSSPPRASESDAPTKPSEEKPSLPVQTNSAAAKSTPKLLKLDVQNFHCENASCEYRSQCRVTRSWTLPDPSCHVLRMEYANVAFMRNSSDVQFLTSGSSVTASGTLDAASCINTPDYPAKLLKATIFDVNATLVVSCPQK